MSIDITVEDRQLVLAYKEYRTFNDPSYKFKNEYFDKHQNYSLNIDGMKVIFDTFYKEHIKCGNLILVTFDEKPITEYFDIVGTFLVRLTPKGIRYVEETYPDLV